MLFVTSPSTITANYSERDQPQNTFINPFNLFIVSFLHIPWK